MCSPEIAFGNRGSSATGETELRFPLPEGVTLVDSSGNSDRIGDELVWRLGTLNSGDVGRRSVTVRPGQLTVAGDVLEVPDARLTVAGRTVARNDQSVRMRGDDAFDFTVSLLPTAIAQRQTLEADLVISNTSPVTISDVTAEIFFPPWLFDLRDDQIADDGDCTSVIGGSATCDAGETLVWNLVSMPANTQQMRMFQPTLSDPPSGTLLQFFSRIRSSSSDGAFVKRTMPVGNFIPLPPARDPAADIIWHNTATGDTRIWNMQGVDRVDVSATPAIPDPAWSLIGTADFSGSGSYDFLWRAADPGLGQNRVWLVAGNQRIAASPYRRSPTTGASVVRAISTATVAMTFSGGRPHRSPARIAPG